MAIKTRELVTQLQSLQEEMLELLESADTLLRDYDGPDGSNYVRAKAYWLAHVKIALTNEHDYFGDSMCSLEDTIAELAGDSCPGCGCDPGEGLSDGCLHPDGCGWAREVHGGE